VRAQLAEDAYKSCSGRLHISITVLRGWGRLENVVVSEFLSNEDLFEACLASSTIPYITERGAYRLFRGMRVIDGGLTNNTPVFRDGTRRQLVFRLSQVRGGGARTCHYYCHHYRDHV
jgi:predicted acylesterase/phospholipase RssA